MSATPRSHSITSRPTSIASIDEEKNSSDHDQVPPSFVPEEVPEDARTNVPRDEERRMLRKFDWMLLPPLAFMYLCNALDKGALANAKTDHFDQDIHLTGNQYYLLITIFYVPFCLFGTPISLFVKRYSAARVLPLMMICFGSMALVSSAVKNFSQIFAARFFLGIFESAMLPGVVFYLSTFYKRNELASRVGIFYAASSISGAFSGLLAFGVFQIQSKYKGWQFLYWIEGSTTIAFATFAFFWLPRSPQTWSFLSPREKQLARLRILRDSSSVVDEKLNIRDAFKPLLDWRYGVWIVISFSLGVPLASVNNFLPQIVGSLGYSPVRTNLLTVAPNIVGTVALLIFTFSSDYFRERSIHICVALSLALTGFIILGSIDVLASKQVAYFATFLLCMGAFAPSVLTSSWYSNNTPSESRRAVVAAVMVAFANSAGLVSSNVFRAQDEPKYVPALVTSAIFGAVCLVSAAGLGLYMRLENRRRDIAQGYQVTVKSQDVNTEGLGDGHHSPAFRFFY